MAGNTDHSPSASLFFFGAASLDFLTALVPARLRAAFFAAGAGASDVSAAFFLPSGAGLAAALSVSDAAGCTFFARAVLGWVLGSAFMAAASAASLPASLLACCTGES